MVKKYGTIKIPREDYERHNERRQAAGLTWAEYLDGESPKVRNSSEQSLTKEQVRELAREEITERVIPEAQR